MYNRYNNRNHGRYNTPGQFVSSNPSDVRWLLPNQQYQQQSGQVKPSQPYDPEESNTDGPAQQNFQANDQDMKNEENVNNSNNDNSRPPWMKSKLGGVKKITNKERRRRQNESLRRLLTPKNALMVLNEMLPKDQIATNFKVETIMSANQYIKPHSYRANLTLDGQDYKGFGENKLMARNAAAEQAIRDLIIRKMSKAIQSEVPSGGTSGGGTSGGGTSGGGTSGGGTSGGGTSGGATSGGEDSDEEPLPMIQLASFALHKLFCEWEVEGHRVPQLKPSPAPQVSESEVSDAEPAQRPTRPIKKPKTLPEDASTMHPCMLLTYMRPALEYRELPAQGDRPQNMLYTFALDVDGSTYIGKASNKKEARRAAAQAACKELFGVVFKNSMSYVS